jgi:hypothetical protein
LTIRTLTNGSEFINHPLLSWCDTHHISFTRSRPYKKNDNCFVEQKNLTCVREYAGYHRFDTPCEHQALARVYRSLCPLLNYFLPTIKLIDKSRVGSKVRKVYDKPMSPYQRLMACPDLPDEVKAELRGVTRGPTWSGSSRRYIGRLMLSWR